MQYFYITGTSSGLGLAIAEKLLAQNNNFVFGISRKQTIFHANYVHVYLDLSNQEQVKQFEFQNHNQANKICLINNAGTLGEVKYTGDMNYENIQTTYQLNLVTPHQLINKFILTYTNEQCEKVVVNISSGAAKSVYDGWSVYGAAKAGLDQLSLCIARELEILKLNMKIFSIAPGVMETGMQKIIRDTEEKYFSKKNKFIELHQDKKLYNPEIVAEKYIDFIQNAKHIQETIHRIKL